MGTILISLWSYLRHDDLDDGILFKIEGLTYSPPQALNKPLVKGILFMKHNSFSQGCLYWYLNFYFNFIALDLEIRSGKNLLVTGKTGKTCQKSVN